LHQDYPYWSFVGDIPFDDFVNVLIPIDPFDRDRGATELFPGYHHAILEGPPDEPLDDKAVDNNAGVLLTLSPGDVCLIHPLTPHRSGPNVSSKNRESLLVTYVRAGHGNLYERYYRRRPVP
jgi:ectoine hydroxylase-related dioxygenase (phytanoyl-CoA dioxygenase family)